MSSIKKGARTLDEALRHNDFMLSRGTINGYVMNYDYVKGSTNLHVRVELLTDSHKETHLFARIGLSHNRKSVICSFRSLSDEPFDEIAGNFLTDAILRIYNQYQWYLADTDVYSDVRQAPSVPPAHYFSAGSMIQ